MGANVDGALVLSKDEEPITTDMPFLTPKTHSYPNLFSILGEGVSEGCVRWVSMEMGK